MTLPDIDESYLLDFLTGLLNTPSPTGYTERATAFVRAALSSFPDLKFSQTRKGALVAFWPGHLDQEPRALTAHIDTLGAMVKEIKDCGRLKPTRIGNFAWNTVEGEGCKVFTTEGHTVRGSLLLTKASSHVHGKLVSELERDDENMEIRLDDRVESAEDTLALGINIGDFIAFDPRVEVNNGFIRSRHLDNKACVACLLAAVKALCDANKYPAHSTYLHFSNYEEVGHGASSGIPSEVAELVTLDMAAVGEGQNSDEFHATLCVMDTGGPYHHNLGLRMRQLAQDHGIPYKVDIYPQYRSDGEALWHAGGDAAVVLIGPGVDASHNYERTHIEALIATTKWIVAYLLDKD